MSEKSFEKVEGSRPRRGLPVEGESGPDLFVLHDFLISGPPTRIVGLKR